LNNFCRHTPIANSFYVRPFSQALVRNENSLSTQDAKRDFFKPIVKLAEKTLRENDELGSLDNEVRSRFRLRIGIQIAISGMFLCKQRVTLLKIDALSILAVFHLGEQALIQTKVGWGHLENAESRDRTLHAVQNRQSPLFR
jgi:hypothetical protein